MHFKPSRLEARAALNGDHKLEARQLGIIQITTADDDPFGWFTSLFGGGDGNGDPTTTTTRPRTTTTIGPVLPTGHTVTNAGTTSRTPTTTTTLPVVVVTATQTPTPTPSPQFTTVTSTSSVDTGAADTSQANVNGSTNNGLPSAVVGIIVAAAIIFGLIFIALVTRKVLQARRRNRRATWATGITPFGAPLTEKALPPPPPAESREYPSTNYPAYPPAAAVGTTYNNTQPYSPAAPSSAAYPASYPFGAGSAPLQMQSTTTTTTNPALLTAADLAGPVVLQQVPATPTSPAPAVSVVKRTFVPSLPDELSISNGEQVRVLSAYDDGWALCERVSNGQKGVVPQECLEMAQQPGVGAPTAAGSENSLLNRKSSLHRNAL